MIKNLTTLIESALDRAEKLKQLKESNLCNSSNNTGILWEWGNFISVFYIIACNLLTKHLFLLERNIHSFYNMNI